MSRAFSVACTHAGLAAQVMKTGCTECDGSADENKKIFQLSAFVWTLVWLLEV